METGGTTPSAYDSDPFTQAWAAAISLAGSGYFDMTGRRYTAMRPRIDVIKKELETPPTGLAVFLAAMVSFYNSELGGRLLKTLQATSPADIAIRLGPRHREALSALIAAFERW